MSDIFQSPIDPAILALEEDDRVRLAQLVLTLRRRGIGDKVVLAALEQVPRRLFVAAGDRARAFDDRPIAIECGQIATAPSVIGQMLVALKVARAHKVLDVGTGSGYTAAVLSHMAQWVWTIDRYQTLVHLAVQRFAALRLTNVTAAVGDGVEGWEAHAPFDRILVSAAAPEVPHGLLGQLAPGGILVMPVGKPGEPQALTRFARTDRGFEAEVVGKVRFVALVPGRAAVL